MNKLRSLSTIILLLLCGLTSAWGQSAYSLSGMVKDCYSGRNIKDAVVTLQSRDTLIGYTLSNFAGKYKFENLPARNYDLVVTHPDFAPLEMSVVLQGNEKLNHELTPVAQIALDSVVVVADRANVVKSDATGETFYLSSRSRKEKSIFDALSEVPTLRVDPLKREIKTMGGESVVILINGMQRPMSLESIDPSQVEAVEVVNNPSAKYLMNGYQHVINLKVKARTQDYRVLNLYTASDVELITNTTSGGFEMGNSKYSFFVNGMGMIHHDEAGKEYGRQSLGDAHWKYDNATNFNYRYVDLTVGGDFLPTQKDYLSYSVYLNRNKEAMDYDGTGTLTSAMENALDYTIDKKYDNRLWGTGGKLFYRRTLNNVSYIESTAGYGLSRLDNEDHTTQEGIGYWFNSLVQSKAQQQSVNYSLEYQRTLNERSGFSVGSNTAYNVGYIDNQSTDHFEHSKWQEYLYGTYRYNKKWFSLVASAGLDIISNTSAGIRDNYYRLKFSGSSNFQINNRHSIYVYANGYTATPSISLLNPANTSSDSTQVIKGNPYLKPAYVKVAGLQYRGSMGNWYLQAYTSYFGYSDIYDRVGRTEGDLYVYSYENKDKKQQLNAGLYARYTIKNAGYVALNGGYQRVFYDDRERDWFNMNFNWRLYYKKLVWSGYIYAQPYTYEQYSKRKVYIDSSTSLFWNINSHWTLGATLRYLLATCKNEYWIEDPQQGYDYYVGREFTKRHNMVTISIQYNWKQREKKRQVNRLQLNKSSLQLLRE